MRGSQLLNTTLRTRRDTVLRMIENIEARIYATMNPFLLQLPGTKHVKNHPRQPDSKPISKHIQHASLVNAGPRRSALSGIGTA
jgi:hypothetical protein